MDKYLGMIKQESNRMNNQVENVLQISSLDKSELELSKKEVIQTLQ